MKYSPEILCLASGLHFIVFFGGGKADSLSP